MKKQTVYLAGGFRSDWATIVSNSSDGFNFVNPKLKEFKNGERVVMDVAKGLGKTVITVLEKNHETILDRYLQFITQVSDITFDNLNDGIEYLKLFAI